MRWFKHLCSSHSDEVLAGLLEEFGPEGYGVWWIILEIIAEQMDKSSKTSATFPLKFWCHSARISAKKFQKILTFLQNFKKISINLSQNYLTIDCPNLAKFRDEYSLRAKSKKNKCRDNIPIVSGQYPLQDTDNRDKDKKEKIKKEKNFDPDEIFAHWQRVMNHPRSKLDDKRKRLILKQLKIYTKEDLLLAIDGCSKSEWHMGHNPDKKIYDGLDLIFRNADKIEGFMQLARPKNFGGGLAPEKTTCVFEKNGMVCGLPGRMQKGKTWFCSDHFWDA